MVAIKIKNLTKNYGKSRGITDVNLSIEQGEIFGFIGPNGSGKSTTIRTLLALISPTSGTAQILGHDLHEMKPEVFSDIGYLPSEVSYYDDMKVNELLNYSASFYKKDCSERITTLAKRLELDLSKKITDLSFGNRKKVGIVQCLLHSPKLIILDEPTSGLDPLMQQNFFDILKEENKKGATIFFSSHILSEVEKICDRVAIIKEGKIIKTEKISTLKEKTIKHFVLEAKEKLDVSYFSLKGVSQLEINEQEIRFLYNGNLDAIMKKLSDISLTNIHIFEPDLEEIFLHYYE